MPKPIFLICQGQMIPVLALRGSGHSHPFASVAGAHWKHTHTLREDMRLFLLSCFVTLLWQYSEERRTQERTDEDRREGRDEGWIKSNKLIHLRHCVSPRTANSIISVFSQPAPQVARKGEICNFLFLTEAFINVSEKRGTHSHDTTHLHLFPPPSIPSPGLQLTAK